MEVVSYIYLPNLTNTTFLAFSLITYIPKFLENAALISTCLCKFNFLFLELTPQLYITVTSPRNLCFLHNFLLRYYFVQEGLPRTNISRMGASFYMFPEYLLRTLYHPDHTILSSLAYFSATPVQMANSFQGKSSCQFYLCIPQNQVWLIVYTKHCSWSE